MLKITPPKTKIWLGYGPSRREMFRLATTPTPETTPLYHYVIGPFLTIRGAKAMLHYGQNNPHMQSVSDAERIGLQYADELTNQPTIMWKNS